ncbi:MAG: DUF1361 domain-containing protein [Cyanosarcina radialis HA8281-LM2]|jgi:uncharacterized membrane protein|nr:DUF1361 domain-containing protein [Cyanosarcina radialis HA8281-LM2]
MIDTLIAWTGEAWQIWQANSGWMGWNLFLALVPLFLSFWLFDRPRSPMLRWGTGILLGITLVLGLHRANLIKLQLLLASLRQSYLGLDLFYIVGSIALTIVLMVLDIRLWSGKGSRSLLWWFGFLIFILFLPNAPYVLTDIIHLVEDIQTFPSIWIITLAIVPLYLLFMFVGFEAYVLSLIYLGDYLQRQGRGKWVLGIELLLHFLSAIGIFLGRFLRLNSWYLFTRPGALLDSANELMGKFPLVVTAITFLVLAALYWIMKQVTLGIMWKNQKPATLLPDPSNPDY